MTLDRFVFDHANFLPWEVRDDYVRVKISIQLSVSYDIVMHKVVKGCMLKFIGRGGTKT